MRPAATWRPGCPMMSRLTWRATSLARSASQHLAITTTQPRAASSAKPRSHPIRFPQGFLIPEYHKMYWMGMTAPTPVPGGKFTSLDPYAVPSSKNPYVHWGTMQPGSITEPNSRFGGETCTVGNNSQTYANAWGWADAQCNLKIPSICIVRRGCPVPAARWPRSCSSTASRKQLTAPLARRRPALLRRPVHPHNPCCAQRPPPSRPPRTP